MRELAKKHVKNRSETKSTTEVETEGNKYNHEIITY